MIDFDIELAALTFCDAPKADSIGLCSTFGILVWDDNDHPDPSR